jgi:hypothetical protein
VEFRDLGPVRGSIVARIVAVVTVDRVVLVTTEFGDDQAPDDCSPNHDHDTPDPGDDDQRGSTHEPPEHFLVRPFWGSVNRNQVIFTRHTHAFLETSHGLQLHVHWTRPYHYLCPGRPR